MTVPEHIEPLRIVGEAFGLPLACFGAGGRTLFATSAMVHEAGLEPADLESLVAAIAPDADAAGITGGLSGLAAPGEERSVELRRPAPNGPGRGVALHAVAIGGPGAPCVAVVIHELPDEAAVIGRMEALERQAQAGYLAAGAAHEFNNLLTSMVGWTQIALKAVEPGSAAAAALQTIENNTRRAKRIATGLLDSARPPRHERKAEHLSRLAEEALRLLSWELTAAHIEITPDLRPAGTIRGDGTRLLQVLVNVIRNAVEAAPSRGALRVSTWRDGERSVIEISDNGHGIPQENLDHIFEPFFTTKTPRPGSTGGTGLGLAISRRIVEEHGGTISVQSRPGATSVTIALPCAESEPPAGASAEETRSSSIPPGIKVLVVDDEPDILEMVRTALALGGAEAIPARAGGEAVALCRAMRFDAAVVDFSMTGLSGFALGRAIADAQPELPIVFMSGIEIPHDPEERFRTFLKKPFDLRDIQCMLHDVLRDDGAR